MIALALIVQIVAPVGASTAMVRGAVDPLADAVVCAGDPADVDVHPDRGHAAGHVGDACALCRITCAGGYAPPVVGAASVVVPLAPIAVAAWRSRIEIVVAERRLDQIRGRAPPVLS